MLITLAPVFGVLAGVVGVVDTVPYVRDIVRGTTRPHRGTWFIWGVLAIVVCVSQRADGASWSLVMAGTQAVLTTFIFVLAIRRGEGGLSATDGLLIAIAAGGMAAWVVVDEPLIPTACVIAADLIACRRGRGAGGRRGGRGRRLAALLPGLLLPGELGARAVHPRPPRSARRLADARERPRVAHSPHRVSSS